MTEPAAPGVPSYAELPQIAALGLAHAWGAFGPDDELGTINHLTAERVRDAATLVVDGTIVNLSLPLNMPDPPLSGRRAFEHELYNIDRNTLDDRLDSFYPQASSQWDGLRHIRAREFGFYGGMTETPPAGGGRLGIEHWAEHGIVGRGVLLDLERFCRDSDPSFDAFSGEPVSIETVAACAEAQDVALRPGDVLCLRFGWTAAYRQLDAAGRSAYAENATSAGLAADEDVARFLWDAQVAAVVCDNPAVEGSPGTPGDFLHRRLLPLLGFALGEMFDFDRLAALSSADGRYEFFFVGVPLNLPGGVGSPANAIAIR
jgi:kynurenine formamidase